MLVKGAIGVVLDMDGHGLLTRRHYSLPWDYVQLHAGCIPGTPLINMD